jgi:hypothetical protein
MTDSGMQFHSHNKHVRGTQDSTAPMNTLTTGSGAVWTDVQEQGSTATPMPSTTTSGSVSGPGPLNASVPITPEQESTAVAAGPQLHGYIPFIRLVCPRAW